MALKVQSRKFSEVGQRRKKRREGGVRKEGLNAARNEDYKF